MSGENVTAIFSAVPANATSEQALAWIERVRRARWEELSADQTLAMTPEMIPLATFMESRNAMRSL